MVLTCMMPFLLTVMHLIMVSYLDWSYSSQDANYIDFSNGDDVCQVYSWYIGYHAFSYQLRWDLYVVMSQLFLLLLHSLVILFGVIYKYLIFWSSWVQVFVMLG